MKISNYVKAAVVTGFMIGGTFAHAKESFEERHPRRSEINHRVRDQEKRIDEGVKAEEHAEVAANGGYLTKTEQKQMNQELNQDSKQIYAEKHPAVVSGN
jgi:hypothetical protein